VRGGFTVSVCAGVCPSLDAELVAEPAGEFFDDLDETLHGSQAGGARLAHRADGAETRVATGGAYIPGSGAVHGLPGGGKETEPGQVIAQTLEFDGGLAFVRIGDAAGEQVGVVGEDVDALAAPGNRNIKLFAVDGAEGARGGDEQDFIDGLHNRGRLRLMTGNPNNEFASHMLSTRSMGGK
jgi:hypothetical protein